MIKLRTATCVFVLTAFAAGAAGAQENPSAIDLTCADIASLGEAHAAALVYYIAGYQDAQMSMEGAAAPAEPAAPAQNEAATDTQLAGEGQADAEAAPAESETETQTVSAQLVGGVSLSAAAVLSACNDSADMRIADVILNLGGSGAIPAPSSAGSTPVQQTAPADDDAAGAEPAGDAAPSEPPAENEGAAATDSEATEGGVTTDESDSP